MKKIVSMFVAAATVLGLGLCPAGAAETKPIAAVFGLAGLYLHLERQFTGRQVQEAHIKLGRRKRREWPRLPLPEDRGDITAADVLAATPGPARDRAIDDWCRSVWSACIANRAAIVGLLREYEVGG